MSNQPNPTVICLGEILVDRIADQVTANISAVQSWTDYAGGAPANVACGLSRLGTRASFVGAVGDDKRGRELVALLQAKGVDTTGVQINPTAPTRSVLVLRSADGDRTFAGFGNDGLRPISGHRATTEFADAQLQAERLPTDWAQVQFLVLGTLGLAAPTTRQAVERAIDLAQTHNCQILLDVNWRPVFWSQPEIAPVMIRALIRQVDWLKLSIEESAWLFDTADPGAIATQFPQLKGVCLTLGAAGCDYWINGQAGHQPGFVVAVQDTTGAGDSFVAGLIHQLCEGASDAAAIVAYACAVGALTTMRTGAIDAQPNAMQVSELLNFTNSSH
jgi:fructokinase